METEVTWNLDIQKSKVYFMENEKKQRIEATETTNQTFL